ncbi:hypothetical protein BX616_001014 [Lobosporangium transversale]|nr:hypothetical protein BX616_001014 [Lobosporangium transversale]
MIDSTAAAQEPVSDMQNVEKNSEEALIAVATTTPLTAYMTLSPSSTSKLPVNVLLAEETDLTAPSDSKKPKPKRCITLTGMPTPPLPPRPVFPTELERYSIHENDRELNPEYASRIQGYLSSVRQDHERQLMDYDRLKAFVEADNLFSIVLVDELDAMDEEPFTLDSFENLMRLHANKSKDFILARVTTQDPNDGTKTYHSYYSAHQINKVLFRTQPEEGLLHRMKARNPLNNMVIVGDVHYYIISSQEVKATQPLSTVRSSCASVASHSSRMSRCSKLAAQAIACQSASARSSPILGSDSSLFSRTSEIESPISVIPPMLVMSSMRPDDIDTTINPNSSSDRSISDDGSSGNVTGSLDDNRVDAALTGNILIRSRRGSTVSACSSLSTNSQNGFQPGKPSRLRQAVDVAGLSIHNDRCRQVGDYHLEGVPVQLSQDATASYCPIYSSMSPPIDSLQNQQQSGPYPHSLQQARGSPSPRNQTDGKICNRPRSNTATSARSDGSGNSAASIVSSINSSNSDQSHVSGCSTASIDVADRTTPSNDKALSPLSPSLETPSPTSAISSSSGTVINPSVDSTADAAIIAVGKSENVEYKFQYLASDDDFLLRSAIRQVFKINALEPWDAILFTISSNALREHTDIHEGEQEIQQRQRQHQHQRQQHPDPSSNLSYPVGRAYHPRESSERGRENATDAILPNISGIQNQTGMSRSMPCLNLPAMDPGASLTLADRGMLLPTSSLSSLPSTTREMISRHSPGNASASNISLEQFTSGAETHHNVAPSTTATASSNTAAACSTTITTTATAAAATAAVLDIAGSSGTEITVGGKQIGNNTLTTTIPSAATAYEDIQFRKTSGGKMIRRALSKIFSLN